MNLYFHLTTSGNWIIDAFPRRCYSWHIISKTAVVRYQLTRKGGKVLNVCFNEYLSKGEAIDLVSAYIRGEGKVINLR